MSFSRNFVAGQMELALSKHSDKEEAFYQLLNGIVWMTDEQKADTYARVVEDGKYTHYRIDLCMAKAGVPAFFNSNPGTIQ